MKAIRGAIALLVLSFAASPSFGVVLANKALTTFSFGWNSNINAGFQQAADDLTLASSATANQLTWYGFNHNAAASANFRLRIFTDAGTQPNNVAFYDQPLGLINGVDTGLDNQSGNSILRYTSPIPSVALNGGQKYWLMIASTDALTWAWSHAAVGPAGNDQFHRDGDAGAWRSLLLLGFPPEELEQAFTLEGIVPEPASLAFVGIALGTLARRRHS